MSRPPVTTADLIEIGRKTPAWKLRLARLMFSIDTRLGFYRALTVYRNQGIRENDALVNWWNILTRRGSRNLHHPLTVLIPLLIYQMHEMGVRWQTAFKAWVPTTDAMMFTASEHSGLSPTILETLIKLTERRRTWSKDMRAALSPPLFNLVFIAAIIAGVGLYYFPALQKSMPGMRLAGSAATLAKLSAIVTDDGLIIVLILATLPFLFKILLDRWTGRGRIVADSLPIFSMVRQSTGMTFLMGLAALLDTGIGFRDAMDILAENATPYVRERLLGILAYDDLRPAEAMAASGFHWPDDTTIELLTLYMETKDPQSGIRVIIEDWAANAAEKFQRLGKMANLLGQLVTWGIVGWLYLVTNDLISATGQAAGHLPH